MLARLSIVAIASVLMLVAPAVDAADDLWKRLEAGGRIVLLRHTITTPGVGDPPGMRLDDCATQRNLSDVGRMHARAIGAAFRERKIPLERVQSSPWCRCIETAQLAFGRSEPLTPLSNLFGRPENAARQVEALRVLIGRYEGKGNLVLVTHGSTIAALTGVSPDTGESVVVERRRDDGFEVVGRLSIQSPQR
ncbi:MAG TPA: histidine phosphatase family protein [Casimicrobiaceae bacterium]|nr:histidine phosphatase family protein [Casimicrobiaceae bacterium]